MHAMNKMISEYNSLWYTGGQASRDCFPKSSVVVYSLAIMLGPKYNTASPPSVTERVSIWILQDAPNAGQVRAL